MWEGGLLAAGGAEGHFLKTPLAVFFIGTDFALCVA